MNLSPMGHLNRRWAVLAGVAERRANASLDQPATRWLPMVPPPCLDETFGSWWHRAAVAYRTTERELARSVLALDRRRLAQGEIDWDTAPPEALLQSLATHSPFRWAELQHLIVPAGPATLKSFQRDGYCPVCFADDKQRGVLHTRKQWLDAWAICCSRHTCVLGTLCPYEYERANTPFRHSRPTLLGIVPARTSLRLNPSVKSFSLPLIECAENLSRFDAGDGAELWLEPAMLQSVVGRDLVMFMGSSAADLLYYRLFGRARLWNEVWCDESRRPLRVPEIAHPRAPTVVRVEAAYLASLVWRYLFPSEATRADDWVELIHVLRKELKTRPQEIGAIKRRWPREDQRRWAYVFERA